MDLTRLPVEIRHAIMSLLDDRSFTRALVASRLWHVCTTREYDARAARWRGCKTPSDFCRAGNLDALKALCCSGALGPVHRLLSIAIEADHVAVAAWLDTIDLAAIGTIRIGSLGPRVLAYLLDRHRDLVHAHARSLVYHAISSGRVEIVCLLGNADIVIEPQWIHMETAAYNRHLPTVRYLCERYPDIRHPHALTSAAVSGDLDLVGFLCDQRDDGCDPEGLGEAAAMGHIYALDLIRRRYPTLDWPLDVLVMPAVVGRLHVVEWVHRHRLVPCQPGLVGYCQSRHSVERWLVANVCACCHEPTADDDEILSSMTSPEILDHFW